MIQNLEALLALQSAGTVSAAAARLRLTQSAVSKRISALERTLGYRVVEPDGRRVRLTPQGALLLERAAPLVAELRSLGAAQAPAGPVALTLALADSVASSWGPEVVRAALARTPGVVVELHAHRSVLVVESVRLGHYQLGLCAEMPGAARDLVRFPVAEEAMVLVRAAPTRRGGALARRGGALARRGGAPLPLITIEPGSATWRAIEPLLRRETPDLLRRERVTVESFAAALQMVRAGFGDGLVPAGVARSAGLERARFHLVRGVSRRITLHCRKTVSLLPAVEELRRELTAAAQAYLQRQ